MDTECWRRHGLLLVMSSPLLLRFLSRSAAPDPAQAESLTDSAYLMPLATICKWTLIQGNERQRLEAAFLVDQRHYGQR
jgi:hypothetical protein